MLTIPFVVPERMLQWAAQRGFIEFEYDGGADNRVPVAVVCIPKVFPHNARTTYGQTFHTTSMLTFLFQLHA
jgi:hypothetical protein